MSDKKQYKTEWSFSFEKLGDSINNIVGSIGGDEEVKMASFSEPIGGATRADVHLHLSVGEAEVKPLAASDNLIEADVTYVGEMEFTTSGGPEKTIQLRQKQENFIKKAVGSFSKRNDLRWDVRLSPDVPLNLNIHAGVGRAQFDLHSLKLTKLELHGGVGENTLFLPAASESYSVKVDGGVGETQITLPEHTPANLVIKGGVGSVKVHVPEGAAVRVTVDGNLGGVKMPAHFIKTKTSDEFITKGGVWETTDFEAAVHKITIDFDGGVGNLQLISLATV